LRDEFQVKLSLARQRLPLERLMAERGKDTSHKKCPYCGKKGGGLFKKDEVVLFKCHHTSCPSGTSDAGGALDQVGFLMKELNLQWKEAAIVLMKEAGVWEERERLAPSVMPGKAGRKRQIPQPSGGDGSLRTASPTGAKNEDEDEEEDEKDGAASPTNLSGVPETSGEIHPPDTIASLSDAPLLNGDPADSSGSVDGQIAGDVVPICPALGSSDGAAGVQSSQTPAKSAPLAGADNAAGALSTVPGAAAPSASGQGAEDENENEDEEEDEKEGTPPSEALRRAGEKDEGRESYLSEEAMVEQCLEIIRKEYAASIALFQRRLQVSRARGERLMGMLEARKVVGPALCVPESPDEPRTILIELDRSKMTKVEKMFVDAPGTGGGSTGTSSPTLEKDRGRGRGRGGGQEGLVTEVDGQTKIVGMDGKPVVEAATPKTEPPPANDGYRVLRDFYERLSLTEMDEKALFEKRGLASRTGAALGFRSNPRTNKDALVELGEKYPWEELATSGLWLDRDGRRKKERRPNAQFFGAGILRRMEDGERPAKGQWVDEHGNLWGWCGPVLIPYVNEEGRLIGLRPHKGGGRGETVVGAPKVYIPRPVIAFGGGSLGTAGPLRAEDRSRSGDGSLRTASPTTASGSLRTASPTPEEFRVVVITEGEFKAAALWQVLGLGRGDGEEPVGIAALPGISFGKNYEIREELDAWLRRVKCRCVKVIYDNEEKGDPKYKAFKADKRKRFDAQIWARFLATDIAQKLHIRGEVGVLPREWRNENGKADWDGAMAEFAKNF
jgi:hypothetical protein